MTLNEKIILPMANELGNEPKKYLHEIRSTMNQKDKNRYNEKWGVIVNTISDMPKKSDKGIMLGDLEKLFVNIGSQYDNNDEIAIMIRGCIEHNLTDIGKKMLFENYYLEEALSVDKRTKYRNPPAHCKYLPYDVACECREYTCELLYTIGTFIA